MVGEGETIRTSSKVDLAELSPCKYSLVTHIKRTHYRVAQFKRTHVPFPELHTPPEHRWARSEEFIEPVWTEGPMLPPCLQDFCQKQQRKKKMMTTVVMMCLLLSHPSRPWKILIVTKICR